MTALVWDRIGERRYEMGIDRGVLYLSDGIGVAWNGLTAVTEERGREVKEYYLDGFKYLEQYVPNAYAAKLQAYTYPDQLEAYLGLDQYAPGVFLNEQESKFFHLSYRSLVGNDIDADEGYKIHIVYNVRAVPGSNAMATTSDRLNVGTFDWSLTGMPSLMAGRNPTNHISLYSRLMPAAKLALIEGILYGTPTTAPNLPPLPNLLALAS